MARVPDQERALIPEDITSQKQSRLDYFSWQEGKETILLLLQTLDLDAVSLGMLWL